MQATAPWGFDFRAEGLASVHLILSGRAVLYQAGEEPLRLEAGDVAVVTRRRDHRLLDELCSY